MYLQGRLQFNGCSASRLHHRYLKPYIKFILNYFIAFQENEFPSFPHSRNLMNQIIVQEFRLNTIYILWKFVFFLEVRTPKAEKCVGVFLNSIAFKSYRLTLFFKTARKTCGVNARKWPSRKEFLELSNSPTPFGWI